MLKLQTPVDAGRSELQFGYQDNIFVLGSCFADNIGSRLCNYGFDAVVNPFGTLYNPVSLSNAVARLQEGLPFREEDCVEMGSGAGLYCSFSHHSSFARPTKEEFLENANLSLEKASAAWKAADVVLMTLGTSFCWSHLATGETVANCLKRPASEFERIMLPKEASSAILSKMLRKYPDKRFIFTVSPVRHLSGGAHSNLSSKASLLLAVDSLIQTANAEYFPAYEIMMDELRDYRFYDSDMLHPSAQAVEYIWERFCDFALRESDRPTLQEKVKAWRRSQHRPLH